MAEIIEFPPKPKKERKCSFCGTKEKDTKSLISNNLEGSHEKLICDKCVATLMQILS